MPGLEVRVTDGCIGCGTCMDGICFVDAIHMVNGHALIDDSCRGCGRCVDICPQNAIKLIINDREFVRKSIEEIDKIIDIT